jgi:hypothetical protein
MPKYSGVTFSVQPAEKDGKVLGFIISGFLTKVQLKALRGMVDSLDYERTKMWRGSYQEMAKAIVKGIDNGLAAAES